MMGYTERDWVVYKDGDEEAEYYYLIAGDNGKTNVALIRHDYENKEANAHLIVQSPRMAEWIAKVAQQDFVVFPEDKTLAKEILEGLTTRQLWYILLLMEVTRQMKVYGTEWRNKAIIDLKALGWRGVDIAKALTMSKQRVGQVIKREGERNEKT